MGKLWEKHFKIEEFNQETAFGRLTFEAKNILCCLAREPKSTYIEIGTLFSKLPLNVELNCQDVEQVFFKKIIDSGFISVGVIGYAIKDQHYEFLLGKIDQVNRSNNPG